jgi:large subunit ribosomal protein L10
VPEPRPEKVAVVDEVRERFAGASAALLTEYRGLKVHEMANLRRLLVAAGGEYKIYKNTLVRRAANETGLEVLEPLLVGPTGNAFVGGDVAAVAKVLREFARTSPALVVKGGLLGTSFLDARSAAALADLPSRETLLSQIAGALAAPMTKFAGLLKAIPQNLAFGLSALIEQRGGVVTEAPAAEEALAEPVDAPGPEPAPEVTEVDATETEAASDAAAADEPAPEPVAAPEPESAAAPEPEPAAAPEDEPAAAPEDEPAAEVEDQPAAEVEPAAAPEQEPAAAPEDEPAAAATEVAQTESQTSRSRQ